MKANEFILTDEEQLRTLELEEENTMNCFEFSSVCEIFDKWYDLYTNYCWSDESKKAAFALFNALNKEHGYKLTFCIER